jgi:hypothetical protein
MRGAGELFLGFGEGGASMARGAGKFVERGGEGLGNMVLGAGKLVEGVGKGGGRAAEGIGSMIDNTSRGAGTFARQGLESGAQIVKSGGNLASSVIDTGTTAVNTVNNGLKMAEAGTAKLVNRFGGNGVIGGGKNGGSLNVGNLQGEKEETKSDFKTRMMEGLSKTTDNIPMQKASGSLLSDNQKKEIKSPRIKEAPDTIGKGFGRL